MNKIVMAAPVEDGLRRQDLAIGADRASVIVESM
jgi:hypothetical protein